MEIIIGECIFSSAMILALVGNRISHLAPAVIFERLRKYPQQLALHYGLREFVEQSFGIQSSHLRFPLSLKCLY